MRILMVLDAEFPTDIRVDKEIETLVGEGHELFLLCYRFEWTRQKKEFYKGAKVIHPYIPRQIAKKTKGLIFHFPFYRWFWRRLIVKAIDAYKPQVIHVHDLPLALPALAVKQLRNVSLVLDLHENYPSLMEESSFTQSFPGKLFFDMGQWTKFEQKAVQESDKVIVVSEFNKNRLESDYGRYSDVFVVPNMSRLDEFSKETPSVKARSWFTNQAINLLYVGGIDESRGLDVVLEGIVNLHKNHKLSGGPDVNFVVVGDGPYRMKMNEKIHELKLNDYVRFPGKVPQEQVGEFIACADICLLPLKLTKHTDLTDPNKLYQYIFYAKPVLATGTRQLKKRWEELQFGLTYQPGDPSDFVAKLTQMLNNIDHFRQYAEKAHQRMEEQFNWDQSSLPLKELYRKFN